MYGHFSKSDLQKELEMIQVHIATLTQLTKLLLPPMLTQKYGRILNVGSTGSFSPGVYNAVYCATKAYILSFSEALSEELKGTGITVTTLCPGATRTEFAQRAFMTESRIHHFAGMNPEKVAKSGYNALMKGKRVVVSGLINKMLVFSIRFTPRNLVAMVSKYLMSERG